MSELQRALAKAQIRPSRKYDPYEEDDWSWKAERWADARRAIAAGTFYNPDATRVPVILTPDGPVSSAKKLQQLAELESVPETIETTLLKEDGTKTEKRVTISHISVEEQKKIQEKADIVRDTMGMFTVLFQEKERYAMVVKSLKEGVTLDEDDSEAGDRTDAKTETADRS